jgi:hypothetical protein
LNQFYLMTCGALSAGAVDGYVQGQAKANEVAGKLDEVGVSITFACWKWNLQKMRIFATGYYWFRLQPDIAKKARGTQDGVVLSSVRVPRRGLRPLLLLYLTALSTTPPCVCPHGGAQRVLGQCVPTLFAAEGAGVDGAVR